MLRCTESHLLCGYHFGSEEPRVRLLESGDYAIHIGRGWIELIDHHLKKFHTCRQRCRRCAESIMHPVSVMCA